MSTTTLPDGSAFSTGVVMSKEEAMMLPPNKRPICFRLSSEMYHATWEAIGAASMTFNADAGNKVFNAEEASNICVGLLFKIADEKEGAVEAVQKELDEVRSIQEFALNKDYYDKFQKLVAENESLQDSLFNANCVAAGVLIVAILSGMLIFFLK